ncbi:MAG: response regulator transcription factor [Propionibacteriaceae bacterium]|jgi:DNA-binding response OmpR family regulator|nr:response regulator transcription factor [Propionibacteriaceae bacterium]
MLRILFTDDEDAIRAGFREYAEFLGHEVTEAQDGMEAVQRCRDQRFDVIVMDVMMPRLDGFTAVKEIRKTIDTPIIVLSARSEEYDKLHGFDLGADDYVTKPFSTKELMARINAVVARSARPGEREAAARSVWSHHGLHVDITARDVKVDGERIELTPKECELLFYLIENRSIALSRHRLLQEVWGYDFFGDERTVDTHIKTLRMKLGPYKDTIVTLRGLGYRFGG